MKTASQAARRPKAATSSIGGSKRKLASEAGKDLRPTAGAAAKHADYQFRSAWITELERQLQDKVFSFPAHVRAGVLEEIRIAVERIDIHAKATSSPARSLTRRDTAGSNVRSRANQRVLDEYGQATMRLRESQLEQGLLLHSSRFMEQRGFSRQALSKAVAEQRIFVLHGPHGARLYPAFFTDPAYERKHLETVCKALGSLPGDVKWQFFTTPKQSLHGKTPLEQLREGNLDEVMDAAQLAVDQ